MRSHIPGVTYRDHRGPFISSQDRLPLENSSLTSFLFIYISLTEDRGSEDMLTDLTTNKKKESIKINYRFSDKVLSALKLLPSIKNERKKKKVRGDP